MQQRSSHRVFLCHAREDKAVVRRVYDQLNIAGFEPWLDERDLLPGQNWEDEIPRALKSSAAVIVFLSQASVSKRGYVQREFRLAVDALQEIPEGAVFIIPVKLDNCRVPAMFSALHWAVMDGGGSGMERVVESLRRHVLPPGPSQVVDQGATVPSELLPRQGGVSDKRRTSARQEVRLGCFLTLTGHQSLIADVSIAQDGRHAVTCSWDNTLRVWDVRTGECLRTLEGHTSFVDCVSLTADGRVAISGSHDNTLRLWDVDTGQCLSALEHGHALGSVSITSDGRFAVSAPTSGGFDDHAVRIWDIDTRRCVCVMHGHEDYISDLSLNPDGTRAISASGDGTLRCWDLGRGQGINEYKGHDAPLSCVSAAFATHRVVSGDCQGRIHVWTPGTCKRLRILKGHTAAIWSVSISRNGKRAASSSGDNTIRIWDVDSGRCLHVFDGLTSGVGTIRMTPDGQLAISGSNDHVVRVWNLGPLEKQPPH